MYPNSFLKPNWILIAGMLLIFMFAGCTSNNDIEPTIQEPVKKVETPKNEVPVEKPEVEQQIIKNESKAIEENKTTAAPVKEEPIIERGTIDPDFEVVTYNWEKTEFGTTIFGDNHISGKPRIIEVNMLGEIVWKYDLPSEWSQYTNPGFDVEVLKSNNILFVLPRKGVFEIDRSGKIVWSYLDSKISHDADRLENGNTIFAFGAYDEQNDVQVKEVDKNGKIVWSWSAKSAFIDEQYKSISDQGWTHTNAVIRLDNGNTLLSMRNFNLLAEIDPSGRLVRTIENDKFYYQHDPEVEGNGTILMANHVTPNEVIEIDKEGNILWKYIIREKESWPVRDADRLANGNILVTGTDRITEITRDREIVWDFRIRNAQFTKETAAARGFYKAERIAK